MPKPRTARLYLRHSFSAAHYLPGYDGPCSKMHGHTWKVEVWMEGVVDSDTGILVDFRAVREIIDLHDHTVLNAALAPFPPTAENLAAWFLNSIPHAQKVRVWESEDAYAEAEPSYEDRIKALPLYERDRLTQGSWKGVAGSFAYERDPANISPYDPAEVQRAISGK